MGSDPIPQPDPVEHIGTTGRDGGGTSVQRPIGKRRGVGPVDDRDLDSSRSESMPQGHPRHTGPDHNRFDTLGLRQWVRHASKIA